MKQGYVIEIEDGFYSKDEDGPTNLSNAEFFDSNEEIDFYIDILNQMGIEVIDVSHAMLKNKPLKRGIKNVRINVN
ncbi:hypothetical protein [Bacillus pseudomycoides]|uniref:hypothetical protein n=1 Tax=Bacillus pseudomycoides TaxID=64104 RepID=UPI0005014CF4|nr:hypothetical protein [Bacillus pseudomycoides]KFN10982.1 hypothetical protein DJ94_5438 [Bacillus pseudomycoides]MCR8860388.1 hypothetical protein [Bacillus pseudomycoides]MDR4188056.1 hypothetical protein [Bacillus pseudomycoides]MED0855673.1 hypothetical protein [Bacillus pseudomycoides]PEN08559.1 hypothetical protein CN640_13020 [Bacillus pseudomycoides]